VPTNQRAFSRIRHHGREWNDYCNYFGEKNADSGKLNGCAVRSAMKGVEDHMPKKATEQVIERQGLGDDLDRWRGESPAAGRVSTMTDDGKGGIGKGLKAVSEYKSTLEHQVRRNPGSSILLASACGVLLGFFLTHSMRTVFGRAR